MFKEIINREPLVTLYHQCFPDNVREEALVHTILFDPADSPFGVYEEEKLIGACLVHGRAITMLAVDPQHRRQGIGSALLAEGERRIREEGYPKMTVGVGTDEHYLMPGVPMNKGAQTFFEHRGYRHSWGETACLDMDQDLADFSYTEHAVGDTIDGITYRWAVPADIPQIEICVGDALESFVPFYQETDHYREGTKAPVLIAEKDGEVLGTLIVSEEVEGEGLGSVGCTATKKAARGRGIATNLVRLGTRYLKDAGMQRGFLGYTYTGIVPMYGRAGYHVCQQYFMAEKVF